jgi:hypothetical protein
VSRIPKKCKVIFARKFEKKFQPVQKHENLEQLLNGKDRGKIPAN